MKVWLVWTGAYSYASVVAAFKCEDDAVAHAAAINALPENAWHEADTDEAGVESLDLYPKGHVPTGRMLYIVEVKLGLDGAAKPTVESEMVWDYAVEKGQNREHGPLAHWSSLGPASFGTVRGARFNYGEALAVVAGRVADFLADGKPDFGQDRV